MPRKAMRDVFVCLPGITGSVLRKDCRDVWNMSGSQYRGAVPMIDLARAGVVIRALENDVDPEPLAPFLPTAARAMGIDQLRLMVLLTSPLVPTRPSQRRVCASAT